ncbi:hypothetical protein [Streptomyces sp. NPDC050264]|uniref:hypothetical protein n=1 Tax=Streptomyces sp. NPDC050264 TaxID=3155038 RepID=UPI0034278180
MTVSQQYALDAYRAAQRGEPVRSATSLHDWGAVRELRDFRRFEAVLAGRPARGRIRAALTRRFATLRGHAAGC